MKSKSSGSKKFNKSDSYSKAKKAQKENIGNIFLLFTPIEKYFDDFITSTNEYFVGRFFVYLKKECKKFTELSPKIKLEKNEEKEIIGTNNIQFLIKYENLVLKVHSSGSLNTSIIDLKKKTNLNQVIVIEGMRFCILKGENHIEIYYNSDDNVLLASILLQSDSNTVYYPINFSNINYSFQDIEHNFLKDYERCEISRKKLTLFKEEKVVSELSQTSEEKSYSIFETEDYIFKFDPKIREELDGVFVTQKEFSISECENKFASNDLQLAYTSEESDKVSQNSFLIFGIKGNKEIGKAVAQMEKHIKDLYDSNRYNDRPIHYLLLFHGDPDNYNWTAVNLNFASEFKFSFSVFYYKYKIFNRPLNILVSPFSEIRKLREKMEIYLENLNSSK